MARYRLLIDFDDCTPLYAQLVGTYAVDVMRRKGVTVQGAELIDEYNVATAAETEYSNA